METLLYGLLFQREELPWVAGSLQACPAQCPGVGVSAGMWWLEWGASGHAHPTPGQQPPLH